MSVKIADNGLVLGEEALIESLIELQNLKLEQMLNRNTEGLFCQTPVVRCLFC